MNKNLILSEFSTVLDQLIRKLNILDRNEILCHGVTVTQCYLIDTLNKKDVMTMNRLSIELGLAISTLTRIIDILVRDKIVQRKRGTEDRRKVLVELTEYGKEISNKLVKCGNEYKMEILKNIPHEKKAEIIDSLNILNNALKKIEIKC